MEKANSNYPLKKYFVVSNLSDLLPFPPPLLRFVPLQESCCAFFRSKVSKNPNYINSTCLKAVTFC